MLLEGLLLKVTRGKGVGAQQQQRQALEKQKGRGALAATPPGLQAKPRTKTNTQRRTKFNNTGPAPVG